MIKAVLTGHSKGLGLGIAQSLLARGYPVLGLSRSIHAELQKQFPTLLQQLPVDLAEHAALQELLVGEALPEFMANATQLLLINNAGLVSPIGPLSVQPASDISRSMQLNVTTPLVLSAADRAGDPLLAYEIINSASDFNQDPLLWIRKVQAAKRIGLDNYATAAIQEMSTWLTWDEIEKLQMTNY